LSLARLRLALSLAVLAPPALSGCRSGPSAGGVDVDAGDGAAPPPHPSTPKLGPTATACDDTRVRACRDGRLADVIQDCAAEGLACSRGRCTSNACAEVERNPGAITGCSFHALRLDNVDSDDPLPSSLV